MLILAIETSCDETSAAVIKDGTTILSDIVSTQVEFHKKYGGIVPEVASRKHIEVINPIIQEAIDTAKVTLKDLDAVAVTYGPGLVGSLLVGLCAAKALAYSLDIPLIGVNHLEGHIYANFLFAKPKFPFICLMVSGGHTMLVLVEDHGKYKVIGRTRDDAAGEAFDKVARFLKLGYPGGPIIDKLAKEGNPHAIKFTRPMIDDGYDFSFSGIKTAVVNFVNRQGVEVEGLVWSKGKGNESPNPTTQPIPAPQPFNHQQTADLAASFQQAVVDVLVEKTIRAAQEFGCQTIALAGGVAANSGLRNGMKEKGERLGMEVLIPPMSLCTDNAAMIGCAGYYHSLAQNSELTLKTQDLDLPAVASLKL